MVDSQLRTNMREYFIMVLRSEKMREKVEGQESAHRVFPLAQIHAECVDT